jgi:hypothetical protein
MNNLERLTELLTKQANFLNCMNNRTDLHYKSAYEFVLKYGQPFTSRVVPSPLRGQPQLCYKNCFHSLWEGGYRYCEGYALFDELGIAIAHAWLLNSKGEVIDPTWREDVSGATYFGAVFDGEYVFEVGEKTRNYGILEINYPNWRKLMIEGLPVGAVHILR